MSDDDLPVPGAQVPSTFLEELQELAGDLQLDLSKTFTDIDTRVGRMVNEIVQKLLVKSDGDLDVLVNELSSALVWFFMMGREHAIRGYTAPVGKSDPDDDEGWHPRDLTGEMDWDPDTEDPLD